MLSLTLFGIFVVVVAATWFMGLWNNLLTLINLILAATIATGYFEAVANALDNSVDPESGQQYAGQFKQYTYLLDFLALWGIFFICFGFLRLCTELLSKYKMKFNIWVELAGRSVLSIWIAWMLICFTTFTLHTAPLPEKAFGGEFQPTPEARNFLGIGPDRLWMAFMQSRSRGALSNWEVRASDLHPDDQDKNYQPFDSKGDFIFRYHHRRTVFAGEEQITVSRAW